MRKCMICGLYQIFKLVDFLDFSHPNVQMCFGSSVTHSSKSHRIASADVFIIKSRAM